MTSGVRVLLVTASGSRRGAELEAEALAEELLARGQDVTLRSLHAGPPPWRETGQPLGRSRLATSTLRALRSEARRSDVVVAYGSSTLPACAVGLAGTDIPFVYRSIGDPQQWLRSGAHRWVTARQFRRAAAIVALWPGAKRVIQRQFGVSAERVVVIPNARRSEDFSPVIGPARTMAREALRLGTRPVVSVIGSLSPEKQVDLAIRTISMLPSHDLAVVGSGPEEHRLRQLGAAVADGQVHFFGHLADIRPVLAASTAVLVSSRTEGMPGVAIEALLSGVPVVSTPVGALPEMPGVDTAEPDPRQLAAALLRASTRSVDLDKAAPFTWSQVAPRWAALLPQIARHGHPQTSWSEATP